MLQKGLEHVTSNSVLHEIILTDTIVIVAVKIYGLVFDYPQSVYQLQ